MIRRPPRSTLDRSSAASDVYKRQGQGLQADGLEVAGDMRVEAARGLGVVVLDLVQELSLIHISEPTRPY